MKFRYNGAVTEFGRVIASKWIAETTAVSEAKARSNLIFRFKQQTGRAPASRIALPDKLELVS